MDQLLLKVPENLLLLLSLSCCGNQMAPLGATQSEKVND